MTDRIAAALEHVSADDRETWVRMGMAVKAELGDAGFDLWNNWSQSAASYDPKAAKAVWKSIKPGGRVTIASLFHEAKAHGWVGERHEVDPATRAAQRREAAARAADDERKAAAARWRAAERATKIIAACRPGPHPYLAAKGFPDLPGLVWERELGDCLLVVPMRVGPTIVNVQLIATNGKKKYLPAGRASEAEHVFDAHGPLDVLVEGYATGLSVRAALAALRVRFRVHVTFSAGNMAKIARKLRPGLVIADNDQSGTGEKVAKGIGWPYWMSPVVGEDANDAHQRMGLFAFSQALGTLVRRVA